MFEKYFCSSSMPYFGEILPRTGPQFAFTDDFNEDDESLKRLDTGLDTLTPGGQGSGGLWCLRSWCPTLAEVPGKCWPLIGQCCQYWPLIGQNCQIYSRGFDQCQAAQTSGDTVLAN